jgi:hypothetical protein
VQVDEDIMIAAVEALMIDEMEVVVEATAQDEMETVELEMALTTAAAALVACESLLILGLAVIR